MNVLLVTNLFPTPSDLVRGVFTLQLAKELSKQCELTVVCPLPWFPKISVLKRIDRWWKLAQVPSEYEVDGIKVYSPKYVMLPKISERLHARLMRIGIQRFLKKLIAEKRIDIINSQWLYPDSVAVERVARSCGIPHVATGLGCDVNEDIKHQEKRDQLLNMLDAVNAVTVVSSRMKDVLITEGYDSSKIDVILNGVDFNSFSYQDLTLARQELKLEEPIPYILYVGRLSEEKSVDTLIYAFEKIKADHPEAKLILIGSGPLQSTLESLVENLNIKDDVKFAGQLPHQQLSSWFSAATLFCLPSKREGCPNVVLESLACGCPVIASDVGALPDIVNINNGSLFEPMNVEALAESLNHGLKKNWDRLAIHNAMKDMTWSAVATDYLHVFDRVLK